MLLFGMYILYTNALSSSNSVSCHIWGGKGEVWGRGNYPLSLLRTAPGVTVAILTIIISLLLLIINKL